MQYQTQTETVFVSDRPILTVRTSVPVTERYPEIDGFYQKMAQSCLEFCRSRLAERLSKEEEGGFFPPYRYGMSAVHVYEDEACFGIRLAVHLRHEWQGRRLFAFGDAQVFDKSDERMLLPREILRLLGEVTKGEKYRLGKEGILPENGFLKIWREGAWQILCPMRKREE